MPFHSKSMSNVECLDICGLNNREIWASIRETCLRDMPLGKAPPSLLSYTDKLEYKYSKTCL